MSTKPLQYRKKTNLTRTSFNLSESTCASSVGGPGLNLDELIAGKSKFGTETELIQKRIQAKTNYGRTQKPNVWRI